MTTIIDKLNAMKEKVETAERQAAQWQGRLEGIDERLRKEFKVNTPEAAEAELARMDKELEDKEAQLAAAVAELEKSPVWAVGGAQ